MSPAAIRRPQGSRFVACPACGATVALSTVNEHLDGCMGTSGDRVDASVTAEDYCHSVYARDAQAHWFKRRMTRCRCQTRAARGKAPAS